MINISSKLAVHVAPSARQNKLIEFREGTLYVRIAAPPVQGKANQELLSFLSEQLGVSKHSLTIVKGHTSRHKLLSIEGLPPEDVAVRLKSALPSSFFSGETGTRHPE